MITSGPTPLPKLPCYVYVDGQYVREELRAENLNDQFDPTHAADLLSRVQILERQVAPSRIFYYDAVLDSDEAGAIKQRAYFDRLRHLPGTHVIEGRVKETRTKREQKGVDVQLAVDALGAAVSGNISAVAIVSGDADFVPLARAIRDAGPHFIVIAFSRSLARELRTAADYVIELTDIPSDWLLSGESRSIKVSRQPET